jgi:hypothetical protein
MSNSLFKTKIKKKSLVIIIEIKIHMYILGDGKPNKNNK